MTAARLDELAPTEIGPDIPEDAHAFDERCLCEATEVVPSLFEGG